MPLGIQHGSYSFLEGQAPTDSSNLEKYQHTQLDLLMWVCFRYSGVIALFAFCNT